MSPETSPVPRLHKCTFVSYKEIHLKLQELCFRVRERSAESGGGKSTGFTAGPQAPQRPHPIPPLAPSTSGMPSSSTLRPHTGSPPLPRGPQGESRSSPPLPYTPQAWYAKRRVTTPRGTLCNSAAGAADRPVEWVLLRASQGPHCWSLSASRSTPQPRGHSGRPGRAPLTWAGRLAFRASPEAERHGWAGWGFYTRPILPV